LNEPDVSPDLDIGELTRQLRAEHGPGATYARVWRVVTENASVGAYKIGREWRVPAANKAAVVAALGLASAPIAA
jgi:hypothetical protein